MNNKPVAWMEIEEGGITEYKVWREPVSSQSIPLYTHPAKTLTDEEIWDFINALCLDMGDYWELTEKNAIPMIRAILRRAQEK